MDTGLIILMCAIWIIGILFGIYIGRHTADKDNFVDTFGVLNVDCSDPDYDPGLYLQLYVPVESVIDQKRVSFDVNVIR